MSTMLAVALEVRAHRPAARLPCKLSPERERRQLASTRTNTCSSDTQTDPPEEHSRGVRHVLNQQLQKVRVAGLSPHLSNGNLSLYSFKMITWRHHAAR